MLAELTYSGLEFDSSVLEVYLGACCAVGALVFLFGKMTASSAYGTTEPSRVAEPPSPLSAPRADEPGTDDGESAGAEAPAEGEAEPPATEEAAPAPAEPQEQRRWTRRRGKPVKVLVSDPAASEGPLLCWVIDRSRGGLGLITPQPLPPGTVVTIRAIHAPEDVAPVEIEIHNCRPRGRRWQVGCQFTAELPWGVLLLFG
jgi:hypothetical protein